MGEVLMGLCKGRYKNRIFCRFSRLLAVCVLLLAGGVYREVESRMKDMGAVVSLPVPLQDFPWVEARHSI